MSNCKYETKNGRCSLKDSYAYRHKCYTEESCKCHEAIEPCGRREPMTNADRIRAMTDEELEQFINHFNICDIRTNEECKMSYCACCEVCVMDWLKQPAEGDA